MTEVKQMLTTEDVAKILNVHVRTVIRMIESGKLPAFKLDRVYRIDPDEFNKFLDRIRTPAPSDGVKV